MNGRDLTVEQAEALFCHALERLDLQIPILILGSKQHLLNQIVAKPKAPLFNWRHHVHFGSIDYHEYRKYMDERFDLEGLTITVKTPDTFRAGCPATRKQSTGFVAALITQETKGELTKKLIDTAPETSPVDFSIVRRLGARYRHDHQ